MITVLKGKKRARRIGQVPAFRIENPAIIAEVLENRRRIHDPQIVESYGAADLIFEKGRVGEVGMHALTLP